METQNVTKKSKKNREDSFKLSDLEVRKTELAFITSVNHTAGQFYSQFCKFSNEELISFNNSVNDHCEYLISKRETIDPSIGVPKKVRKGNVFCVKFYHDNVWYRAQVLQTHIEDQTCTVRFIDYGNEEIVEAIELLDVDAKQFPMIARTPFGVTCSLSGFQDDSKEKVNFILDCLHNNYVMIKPLELLPDGIWKVRIPLHAYNMPFWMIFNTEKDKNAGTNLGKAK